jgi:pimeloyl-ACP methyl ester carboxylesterase
LMSRLSSRTMARQTLVIFSTHDPEDGLEKLSPEGIKRIARFYRGRSSRQGALNDGSHTVGAVLLKKIKKPVLVIYSREDKSVPFDHAEWSLNNIPHAELFSGSIPPEGDIFQMNIAIPAYSLEIRPISQEELDAVLQVYRHNVKTSCLWDQCPQH